MKPRCSFCADTLLRVVLIAALAMPALLLMGATASAAGVQDPSPAADTVQYPAVVFGDPGLTSFFADDGGRAAILSEETNGLVALTASLSAMSVIGLASGIWYRATSRPRRRDE
ncbi:MAG: hypothetical protein WD602_05025 [Actinomycetota bacterium]